MGHSTARATSLETSTIVYHTGKPRKLTSWRQYISREVDFTCVETLLAPLWKPATPSSKLSKRINLRELLNQSQSQRLRHSSGELDLISCSEILQDLQYQCEVLHDAAAALHSNKETLEGLQLLFENVPKQERKILKHDINCCISQLRLDINSASNLITETKQMSALVRIMTNPLTSCN
jgi:hypothetical protein